MNDSAADLSDLYFAPVIASYHVSEVEHWSFGLYVYASTAEYDPDRLANPGLNVWTVSPGVGYTYLFQRGRLESACRGDRRVRPGRARRLQERMVWRLDGLRAKRIACAWRFGGAAGWIQQLQDVPAPPPTCWVASAGARPDSARW